MFSLEPFIDGASAAEIQMDAIMVIQGGRTLALHRFRGGGPHEVYSIAKSYTSVAVGMAMQDGLLGLDDRPCRAFPELLPETMDPRWEQVRLRDLLTMRSGHDRPYLTASERRELRGETPSDIPDALKGEWLRYVFATPLPHPPGERMRYSNLCPYVAGRMVERAVGRTLLDYLYERLWQPAGVARPRWASDTSGHTFGASDLALGIADMAQLGLLLLGEGELGGRRYLSREWVREATFGWVEAPSKEPRLAETDRRYGYYFWRSSSPTNVRAFGREGQFVIVFPEREAVVATQAMHHRADDVLDLVWTLLLPQL